MKTKSLYLTVVMAFLFAVGCGSNNNVSCPAGEVNMNGSCQMSNVYGYGATSSCMGSCPGGLVQTAYGCLSQANCSPCMGSYNGQCVQATAVGSAGGTYPYGSTYPYGTTGTTGYPYGYTGGTTGYPYGYTSGYPYGYIP